MSSDSNNSLNHDIFKRPRMGLSAANGIYPNRITYSRQQMYNVNQDMKLVDKDQIANQTFNTTVADVTLHLNTTSRCSNFSRSTIYDDDFTHLKGEKSVILEDGDFSTMNRNAHLYVNRRSLNNMKHQIVDTWVPFSKGWSRWVPDYTTNENATKYASELCEVVKRLNKYSIESFMSSMHVGNKECQLCSQNVIIFESFQEMLVHFLSPWHIQSIYKRGKVISSMDIMVLETMIEYIKKMAPNNRKTINSALSLIKKPKEFFRVADDQQCIDSLTSLTVLTSSLPLFNESVKGQQCEYIESIVILQLLEEQFRRLDLNRLLFSSYRFRNTEFFCSVCRSVIRITTIASFCDHIYSEKHTRAIFNKGINRNEAEYWYNFCRTVKEKSKLKNVHFKTDMQSLQEIGYPLCVDDEPSDEDFVFKEPKNEEALKIVMNLIGKEVFIEDELFPSKFFCSWCDVVISTKLHFVAHILYSKTHLMKLPFLYLEDLRCVLQYVGVKCSAPLLEVPKRRSGEVILNEEDLPRMIEKLRQKIRRADLRHLCSKTRIALTNYCELCDVKLEYVEDVKEHLVNDEHWDMNKYTRRTLEHFAFWTAIPLST